MIPKPTPAERRADRYQKLRSLAESDISRRLGDIERTLHSFERAIAAGNAGGVVATLAYIGAAGVNVWAVVVLTLYVLGVVCFVTMWNFELISRQMGVKKKAHEWDALIAGTAKVNTTKLAHSVPDLDEMIASVRHELQSPENELRRKFKFVLVGCLYASILSVILASVLGLVGLWVLAV